MAETKPLIFTMLGPRGAGKTSMLACMNIELESMIPGTFYPDRRTFQILEKAYNSLKIAANPDSPQFDVSCVTGTQGITPFDFKIKGNKSIMPVRFFDIQGGYITGDTQKDLKGYDDVMTIMKNSSVFIVAVDTPYLMEPDYARGKYADQAHIRDVERMIKEAVAESDKQERLILLVPIKCEKYMENFSSQQALKDAVKNAFHDTIKMGQETYKGKLAIAIVPINTLGNVKFSGFKTEGGRVTDQTFLKISGKSFKPEYTDQPLRFAMSFLFEQFKKQQKRSKSILRKMLHLFCIGDWEFFSPDNMPDIAKYVRNGISSGSIRNEIICGRELMGV